MVNSMPLYVSPSGTIRTGAGAGQEKVAWTLSSTLTKPGNVEVASDLIVQGTPKFNNAPVLISGASFLTTTGNANQQIAKARVFAEPLMGNGTGLVLPVSSTCNFAVIPGEAGTITKISAGAITIPSASGSVAVRFYKNSTANPITGSYDLNSGSAGVAASIPLTGNTTIAATDIILCVVTTGSSLNSCSGASVSVEVLTNDY